VGPNIDRRAASWWPHSLRTTSALPVHARFPRDLARSRKGDLEGRTAKVSLHRTLDSMMLTRLPTPSSEVI
jgi:hypothetical protein